MLMDVYHAFRAAGTPEPEARKAAEALSSRETRFDALDRKIDRLDAKIENRFSKREGYIDKRFVAFGAKIDRFDTKFIGELSLVKWMIGFFLASVAVNDAKLFLR